MHVVIIGGGIGGLALAHGLRGRGIEVSVHERDHGPSARWEGYRIHIDAHGHHGLRECLPEPQWRAFLATAGRDGGITFHTDQLTEHLALRWPTPGTGAGAAGDVATDGQRPIEDHHAVDRAVLRRILLSGLDEAVHFGAEFTRYQHEPDGRITAFFADGSRVTGDLLVGADGAGSRVRRQYLPDAGRHETGAVGIGHKVFLDDGTRGWLPAALTRGMSVTSSPAAGFLFTAVFEPPPDTAAHLRGLGIGDIPTLEPYVLGALVADRRAFTVDPVELQHSPDPEALPRAVDRFVAAWHPDLRRMLAASDPASRGVQVFRASVPTPAWTPTRVTVLGDAIHQMPPVGGMGGNTALRDAALLGRLLAGASHDATSTDLLAAVSAYETQMRTYAYPIVRKALAMQTRQTTAGVWRHTTRNGFFRLANQIPTLRRRVFDPRPARSTPQTQQAS